MGASVAARGRQDNRKLPGVVNLGGALAVLLLTLTVALRANQANPPAVAEFAPQPQHPIQNAPQEQTSTVGNGQGGGGGGAPAPSPSPPPPPGKAVFLRCVGDPPRQIEDPQSPPCVPFWQGDNGGATWSGVNGDTIRIALPHIETGPAQSGNAKTRGIQDLENFFNKRFEFYGRKILLVDDPANGSSPAQQLADAQSVAAQNVFASMPHVEQVGSDYYYMDDLARLRIISVDSSWDVMVDEAHLAAHAPYEWTLQPAVNEIYGGVGEWICKQLAGRPASFAGAPYVNQTRRFGLIYGDDHTGDQPDLSMLRAELEACHVDLADTEQIGQAGDDAGTWNSQATSAMIAMRQKNVTSVISIVHPVPLVAAVMPAASNQGYQPEWVLSSYELVATDGLSALGPRDQVAHAIGITYLNKPLPQAARPINWALQEMDPGQTQNTDTNNDYVYWPLLFLASAIQMAGPHLTPEAFQAGLFRALFPNPGSGAAPYFQAHVGFGPSHAFFNDAAAVWMNFAAYSPDTQAYGAFCYAYEGARFSAGQWPSRDFPGDRSQCLT